MEMLETVTFTIPDAIDFGFCPVNESTQRVFTIRNPNPKQPIKFSVTNESPFEVQPLSGVINPRGKVEVMVQYTPSEAVVLVATVVFHVQGELDKVLKLSAIGKFAYITLNKETFNFEEMLIGESATKNLVIKNQGLVPTTFHIIDDEDYSSALGTEYKDNSFSFDIKTGNIPAGQSFLVKITYTPSVVYMLSSKNYVIQTESGNSVRFTCLGSGMGLNVHLSSRVCNFGEVRTGNSTSRVVTLENESNHPASFKFFTDSTHIFRFKKAEGTVQARSNIRIMLYFNPKETMAYYKRVFCLVRNHQLLYLELMGSCYDILHRPLPLTQKDIEAFRTYVLMGTLESLVMQSPGMLTGTEENYALSIEVPMDAAKQIALHKEFMQSLKQREVGLSEEWLDFGFGIPGRHSEARSFNLSNKFGFEIYVMWLIPGKNQPDGQSPFPYNISPISTTIPPYGQATFHVDFCPDKISSYFFNLLNAQIYIKRANSGTLDEYGRISTSLSMTQQNLNASSTHMSRAGTLAIPPISIQIPCVGHSFQAGFQTFIPMIRPSPRGPIQFPPCAPTESVYQTLQIHNIADTPCYYKTIPDQSSQFKIYPPCGFIDSKSFTLIALEFNPKDPGSYQNTVTFYLNHSSTNTLQMELNGVCCDPTIIIDNEARIFYPPLFTGVSSKQKVGILNSSHIPIYYEILIPDKYRDELTVEPYLGTMYPHERINIEFKFTPLSKKEYRFNVPIKVKRVVDEIQDGNFIGYFNPGSGRQMYSLKRDPLEKTYHVTINGSGGQGQIDMNPKKLVFNTVSVGFAETKSFILSNISNCAIYVKLIIEPESQELLNNPGHMQLINTSFSFDFNEGILAANSNQKVNLRFVPNGRSKNSYYIKCLARQNFPNSTTKEVPLSEESCILLSAHGDFPVITISDLRCKSISPARLWKQFDLTNTINCILSPLTSLEIKFNNAEIAQTQAQDKLNRFEWDFGKMIQSSRPEPRKILLTLKNCGGVSAGFKFVLPSDNALEIEGWADTGEKTPEEEFEEHIINEKIFEIHPRQAQLECEQSFDVELLYNPIEVDKHHLTVLFQIVHGKPIVIKLKGETLPSKRGYLELRTPQFEFDPLPIGLRLGISQPIEMKNLSDAKVTYQIDFDQLDRYTEENYNFSVFEVTNPEGTVEPGEISHLFCTFKPIESKNYNVIIPIIVFERGNHIQTLQLSLSGSGYHSTFDNIPPIPSIFDTLPSRRASFLPKSSDAGFSLEEIDFGATKIGKPVHRKVILYNRNPDLKLRYAFKSSTFFCGDDILMDPIGGSIPCNSFMPIKLILTSMRLPGVYEGELECVVEWENRNKKTRTSERALNMSEDAKSDYNFIGGEMEMLYLRVKKRIDLDVDSRYMEVQTSELPLFQNIIKETVQNIVTETNFGDYFDYFENEEPAPVISQIDNDWIPNSQNLIGNQDLLEQRPDPQYNRDFLVLKDEFQDISKYILDCTVFNIMCEGLFGEVDLVSQPRSVRRYRTRID